MHPRAHRANSGLSEVCRILAAKPKCPIGAVNNPFKFGTGIMEFGPPAVNSAGEQTARISRVALDHGTLHLVKSKPPAHHRDKASNRGFPVRLPPFGAISQSRTLPCCDAN